MQKHLEVLHFHVILCIVRCVHDFLTDVDIVSRLVIYFEQLAWIFAHLLYIGSWYFRRMWEFSSRFSDLLVCGLYFFNLTLVSYKAAFSADTVGWTAGKASGWHWVLAWLSVWSEVQTCICPSWCYYHSLSLASVKSRLVLPFWYRLTRVVLDKGPLNGCVCCQL